MSDLNAKYEYKFGTKRTDRNRSFHPFGVAACSREDHLDLSFVLIVLRRVSLLVSAAMSQLIFYYDSVFYYDKKFAMKKTL